MLSPSGRELTCDELHSRIPVIDRIRIRDTQIQSCSGANSLATPSRDPTAWSGGSQGPKELPQQVSRVEPMLVILTFTALLDLVACVDGVFKIESPSGKPVAGMVLRSSLNSTATVTDSNGEAVISLPPNQDFIVHGQKPPSYQELYIFGRAGSEPFNYTTYMGTRLEAQLLARLAGDPYDPSLGYIVVGLDALKDPDAGLAPSNLIPAIGATALVQGINGSAPAFVLDGIMPVQTQTISSSSNSFVTFPNKVPGAGVASAQPPAGQRCAISPGMGAQPQKVTAFPDAVSVVSFVCRPFV